MKIQFETEKNYCSNCANLRKTIALTQSRLSFLMETLIFFSLSRWNYESRVKDSQFMRASPMNLVVQRKRVMNAKKWLKSKLSQCKSASKSWKIVIDRSECNHFKYIDTFSIKLNYLRQWNIFMWSQRVNANKKLTFYRRAAKFIRISHTISSSITYIFWRSQNCTTFLLCSTTTTSPCAVIVIETFLSFYKETECCSAIRSGTECTPQKTFNEFGRSYFGAWSRLRRRRR